MTTPTHFSTGNARRNGSTRPLARTFSALCLVASLGAVGCTSTSTSTSPSPSDFAAAAAPPPAAPTGETGARNVLSAGDVIVIAFSSAAELNQSQKIRRDGRISLPMVGEVTAAGKSPETLQVELDGKYAEFLQESKVSISIASTLAAVYVNGEVRQPGKVPLERQMTVFEAIMESGGFSSLANSGKVILTRSEGGKLQRHVLNLKNGSEDAGFPVKPFDTITVSQSWF